MKKNNIIIMLLSLIMTGFMSCADNTDFSSLHNLTDAEQAEMARLDSIRQAQLTRVNAHLILQYTANITISKTSYEGALVAISMDSIAATFGITVEELAAGILGESGAPEIKGFAIQGSTRDDVGTATNTNSPWGHWWDTNGDITTWGETAMTFAEFDPETGVFFVGQYPGRLTDGQTIKFIEALKYNDKRVAVIITVNAKAAGEITASVVRTQELNIDVVAKSNYDADSLEFNLTQALSDLGISSLNDAKYIAVNSDGSYAQETTAPPAGFWYDMDGFAGAWGDNASVYTSYGDFADNKIGIGQFPGHLKGGDKITINYGFLANNKIVMLKININVEAYQDPETQPEGDPKAVSENVVLAKAYSNDYVSIKYDVKDILRDAFKKTTFQIHQAIMSGELKLYQGEVSETAPTYTADAPGYWLNSAGVGGGWAEGLVWCSLGHSETELYLYGGNHPDNGVAGSSVVTKYIATYNGGSVTFDITFNITEAVN